MILMKLRRVLILLGFWGISIFSSATYAITRSPIGVVISIHGQAAVSSGNNEQRPLQRGSTVYLYDKITTKQDSKAQLRLKDDSIIVVQPASEFYVSEFSFNQAAPHSNKYVGNIVKGALINISGQGETTNYKLNSPLTTIAFRGTGIATKLVARGSVLTNQEVFVFQGSVSVTNRCENVMNGVCGLRSINIGAGQQINAATISRIGEITGYKSAGLLEGSGLGGKVITSDNVGGVAISCKGRR